MRPNWHTAGMGLAFAIFAGYSIWLWRFGIDDAGISWRYAQHLVAGNGLRWNVDGPVVEGYSNLLWVLILAAFHWLGAEIELTSHVLGVIIGGLNLLLIGRVCRRLSPESGYCWVPPLLVALTPEWNMWGMSGLELSLFGTWLLLLVMALTSSPKPNGWLFSAGLCGLTLTRPEGVAVAITALFAWWLIPQPVPFRRRIADTMWPFLALVVTAGGLVLFRLWYYGYPLPNTIYAKFALNLPAWYQAVAFLEKGIPFWIAGLLVVWWGRKSPHLPIFLTIMFVVFAHTLMTTPSKQVMNFLHRYHMPFWPLLMLPLPALLTRLGGIRLIPAVVIAALMLWCVLGFSGVSKRRAIEAYAMTAQRCVAEQLLELPGRPTVALVDAGRILYWANLPGLDAWGLADSALAHNGYSPYEVARRKPQVYVSSTDTLTWGLIEPSLGNDKLMFQVPGFSARYRLWRPCIPEGNPTRPTYGYAIMVDAEWAQSVGVRIPERREFWPKRPPS